MIRIDVGDEFVQPVEKDNQPEKIRRMKQIEDLHDEKRWRAQGRRAPLVHCLGSFSSLVILKEIYHD
ncbi:MAG: hypothetical protein L0Z70_07840 [Chloroflexi bacterium]|nr:hypothetical protein [Chloroflexota bacterium]